MESNYANPVRRLFAFLIDGLLITVVANLLILRPNTFPGLIDTRIVAISILYIIYEAVLVFYQGWTVGRLLFRIRVVNYRTGQKPSLLQCLVRPWAKIFFGIAVINSTIVSFAFLLFIIANFYKMVNDREHRAIHDAIAGTAVVRFDR